MDKIQDDIRDIKDRREELESRMNMPRRFDSDQSRIEKKYAEHFENLIRKRFNSPKDEEVLRNLAVTLHTKDITVGSQAGGGYALPKYISDQIEKLELKLSPVRQLVRVEKTSTTDFHKLLNIRGTTSGWVSESGSRSPSNTPQLRDIVPTFGELYAYPQASEWSMICNSTSPGGLLRISPMNSHCKLAG
jgi:HK97 family phage major capsid protein